MLGGSILDLVAILSIQFKEKYIFEKKVSKD